MLLGELRASKTENEALMENCSREREALDVQETQLRIEVERVNAKYEWFLDFKNWVEEVASFLDEKFPALEKIENDNLAVQRERMEMVDKRREMDDSDDVALFTGALVPPNSKRIAEDMMDDEDAQEVDEMGRARPEEDLDPRSFSRRNRRKDRQKRRQLVLSHDSASSASLADGYLTDDELIPSDSQDLSAAGEGLLTSIEGLFIDVESEDFRDPSIGLQPKFAGWKHLYRAEYVNAFAGLGMIGAWEFWARSELAAWNPFNIEDLPRPPSSLEEFRWHRALVEYQHARAASAELGRGEDQLDLQDDVVNGMVATVVVPRLRKLALDGYDAYSSKATDSTLTVMEEITYSMELTNPKFEVKSLAIDWLQKERLTLFSSL